MFVDCHKYLAVTQWDAPCPDYVGYPFQYMCANDELHPCLFLFIHITGKLFHIALSPLILERISHVARTGEDHKVRHPIIAFTICYKHSFSLPDASEIWYVLREKASNSGS